MSTSRARMVSWSIGLALGAGDTHPFGGRRGAIQCAELVLRLLDGSEPPSYPREFLAPALANGARDGRRRLSDDVAAAVRIMAAPAAIAADHCPPISDILSRATLTNAYFEVSGSSIQRSRTSRGTGSRCSSRRAAVEEEGRTR